LRKLVQNAGINLAKPDRNLDIGGKITKPIYLLLRSFYAGFYYYFAPSLVIYISLDRQFNSS
jgi:hypothetical protein